MLWKKIRSKAGYTMAELLIVLGILGILFSIGFVAVVQYQKDLKLTEMDHTAKELFLTAQNYLMEEKSSDRWNTLVDSESEGYFGKKLSRFPADYVEPLEGEEKQPSSYRYLMYSGSESQLQDTLLQKILPLGSIDEAVRTEGTYIIEYDYETATVYGVFYTEDLESLDYESDIMGAGGLDQKGGRKNTKDGRAVRSSYYKGGIRAVIGYYGGAVAEELKSGDLDPAGLTVDNGNELKIRIEDSNYHRSAEGRRFKTKVRLSVTGEESGITVSRLLSEDVSRLAKGFDANDWWTVSDDGRMRVYELTLDDITRKGGHFADLFSDLIPGENIVVEAEILSSDVLARPVKAQVMTNSLFERAVAQMPAADESARSTKASDQKGKTKARAAEGRKVVIDNIRHLQNLNTEVSGINDNAALQAAQNGDLNWNTFADGSETIAIYSYDEIAERQKKLAENSFYGIENENLSLYEGNGFSIEHLQISQNERGDAGLFARKTSEAQALTIQNLVLKDTTVRGSSGSSIGTLIGEAQGDFTATQIYVENPSVTIEGNGVAGGLIGVLHDGTLERCGVYWRQSSRRTERVSEPAAVQASQGIAGGVVGEMSNSKMQDTFSAVSVSATQGQAAGGAIGVTSGNQVQISASYSSGQTKEGEYTETYNVNAGDNGTSGGFIGINRAWNLNVKNSYSTASAYGRWTAGFTGNVVQGTAGYESCYVTGQIGQPADAEYYGNKDAFSGYQQGSGNVWASNSSYLKQSNENLNSTVSGVSEKTYDELADHSVSSSTYSYDASLEGEEYPFIAVTKSGARTRNSLPIHYGDWPTKKEEASDAPAGAAGLVYYEMVDGKLYYHGYLGEFSENGTTPNYQEMKTPGENLENGLLTGKGKYVTEDGYLVLVPTGADLSSIYMQFKPYQNSDMWQGTGTNALNSYIEAFRHSDQISIPGYDVYYLSIDPGSAAPYVMVGTRDGQMWEPLTHYVSFMTDPRFGDTVRTPEQGIARYPVRSMRHLSYMNSLSWEEKQSISFEQQLDLKYADVSTTRNGVAVSYPFQTINDFYAGYDSKKVGTQTYSIHGLTVPMFGNIWQEAKVSGVTLTGSIVNGISAFAGVNYGLIDSCSVRPSYVGADAYSEVLLEGNVSGAAGFIQKNVGGTIQNSSFIGTIKGENVSGFINYNQGTILSCYANALITGEKEAHGFLEYNNQGTIRDSAALGVVSIQGGEGIAYGFIRESNSGTIADSYNALLELSGKDIYMFGPGRGSDFSNCMYLSETNISGTVQTEVSPGFSEIGTAASYESLQKLGTSPETYKFGSGHPFADQENKTYPFPLKATQDAYQKLSFWGDWPKQPAAKRSIGLMYYEIVNDQFYYHGYLADTIKDGNEASYEEIKTPGDNLENGLLSGKGNYVTEDGYLVLVSKGMDVSGIYMMFASNQGGGWNPRPFSSCVETFQHSDRISIPGYDIYYLSVDQESEFPYVTIGTRYAQWSPFTEYAEFIINAHFGDTVRTPKEGITRYPIRSQRQLSYVNMLPWMSIAYEQQLDLNYADVTMTCNGAPASYSFQTISNFSGDYQSKKVGTETYSIHGLTVPMFEYIWQGAKVTGVTLTGSKVTGSSVFARENFGLIDSCSVRPSYEGADAYSEVVFQGNITNTAGFVHTNRSLGTIKNSSFIGTIDGEYVGGFVNINEGTILSCYANAMITGTKEAYGFLYDNNGGIIRDSASLGQVSVVGGEEVAYGFLGKSHSGVISDNYSALMGLYGKKLFLFGACTPEVNYQNCFWLDGMNTSGKVQQSSGGGFKEIGTAISYESLQAMGGAPETHKFGSGHPFADVTASVYPFPLKETQDAYQKLPFWGDWPKKP